MEVLKVVVDKMPEYCKNDCPLKERRGFIDEDICGKRFLIKLNGHMRLPRVPDHRCLCVLEEG